MQKTHLQGIGMQPAITASEIMVGTVLLWNYGATSVVAEITKETAKSIVIKERCSNGKIYQRRMLKNRLVGILTK